MNKLELTYDCSVKHPAKDAKVILNGEDVTAKTIQIVFGLEYAFIEFHKGYREGERLTEKVRLDEVILND